MSQRNESPEGPQAIDLRGPLLVLLTLVMMLASATLALAIGADVGQEPVVELVRWCRFFGAVVVLYATIRLVRFTFSDHVDG